MWEEEEEKVIANNKNFHMIFTRTVGYTILNPQTNEKIVRELRISQITKCIE
jgi:hypothetical protein